MATGILGAINGAGTLTYTAQSNAKVFVNVGNVAGAVTINGAVASASVTLPIYMGAGQTLTVVVSSNGSAVASTLEEV